MERSPLLTGRDKQALATYKANNGVVKTCLQLIVFHAVSRTKWSPSYNVHINIVEWTAKLMCDWHIDGLIYCGLSVIRIACMTNLFRMASWLHFACLCMNCSCSVAAIDHNFLRNVAAFHAACVADVAANSVWLHLLWSICHSHLLSEYLVENGITLCMFMPKLTVVFK